MSVDDVFGGPTLPAHFTSLDPRAPEQKSAIIEAMRESWEDPGMEAFCAEVVQHGSDEELRSLAKIACARYAYHAGDLDKAGRLCREALQYSWGSNARTELNAATNLALVCLDQRRLFESLVAARHACRVAKRAEHTQAQSYAALHLANVMRELGDLARAKSALATSETHRANLAPEERDRYRCAFEHLHADLALLSGDHTSALRHLDHLQSCTAEAEDPCFHPFTAAKILFGVGQCDEAMRMLDRCKPFEGRDISRLDRDWLRVEILEESVGPEPAIAATRELLTQLQDGSDLTPGQGRRMWIANHVGRLFERHGDAAAANVAYRVAAAAALARSAELNVFLRDLPGLRYAEPEDQVILEEYRNRFAEDYRDLLRAIVRMHESAGGDHARQLDATGAEQMTCACAWCARVRGPDQIWIPFEDYDDLQQRIAITHGICETCHASVVAEIATPTT